MVSCVFPLKKLNPHIVNLFTETRFRSFRKGKLKLKLVAVFLVCNKLLLWRGFTVIRNTLICVIATISIYYD